MKRQEGPRDADDFQDWANDLLALLALPALWSGGDCMQVMKALLEVLLGMLRLELAYVEVMNPAGGAPLQMARLVPPRDVPPRPGDIGAVLRPWLEAQSTAAAVHVPHPAGEGDLSIAMVRLGLHGEMGWLAAGALRADFPTGMETLLLTSAANQAATGLKEAWLLAEQTRLAAELEHKVEQRTRELQAEHDRLGLLLDINKTLVENRDLHGLFRVLSDTLWRVIECDFIGLSLPDPACGLRQQIAIYRGKAGAIVEGMVVPVDGSASGKAYRTRQLVYMDGLQGEHGDPDLYGTPEGKRFYKFLLNEGVPSGYFLPLIHGDQVIAVMQLTRYAAAPLKPQAVDFLNALASQLAAAVANALEHRAVVASRDQLAREQVYLREEIDRSSMFEEIVGTSRALKAVLSLVSKVAPAESTVLITGETGTGKELIARAIHKRSPRADKPFVSVNCAAIPVALISAELFGHEKGAFTGAQQRRPGRFELAQGGTLFLDEVGEIPAEVQVALLRVLQEREFERVGGTSPIPVDVRLIAATNRDLSTAVADGMFRSDLFYRLNVFPIEMPTLRARTGDIAMLTEYFLHRYAAKLGKKMTSISRDTLELFQSYPWPGNIRELQNVIERSLIVCETDMFSVDESWLVHDPIERSPQTRSLSRKLAGDQKAMIEAALAESRGRVSGPSGAAVKLGIPASTLESKIRALGINKYSFKASR